MNAGDKVHAQTWDHVVGKFGCRIWDKVADQIHDKVAYKARDQVVDQVGDQVLDTVWDLGFGDRIKEAIGERSIQAEGSGRG